MEVRRIEQARAVSDRSGGLIPSKQDDGPGGRASDRKMGAFERQLRERCLAYGLSEAEIDAWMKEI